ncbi:MAG: GDSL-type esterase/lipase family protein [Oculatellaceae cyanobacterium Prado106]|nr:GDSL-type esterase/lipase family protein [Oculatellaceae cyanobacterium Prado106]
MADLSLLLASITAPQNTPEPSIAPPTLAATPAAAPASCDTVIGTARIEAALRCPEFSQTRRSPEECSAPLASTQSQTHRTSVTGAIAPSPSSQTNRAVSGQAIAPSPSPPTVQSVPGQAIAPAAQQEPSRTPQSLPQNQSSNPQRPTPEAHPSPASSPNPSRTAAPTASGISAASRPKPQATPKNIGESATTPTDTTPAATTPTATTPAISTRIQPNFNPQSFTPRSIEPTLPDLLPRPLANNPYLPSAIPTAPLWSSQVRPRSGSQFYQQRMEALRQGKTYTRLPSSSFYEAWANATEQPTYEQWMGLLQREAQSMAKGQGKNRLTVLVGDSISQWYPIEQLAGDRFWLNQGISGDMTAGILRRLSAFDQTRPDRIYVMAGVNDLKNGRSDREILDNLQQMMQRLRRVHPQAQIVFQSILPTRWANISSDRTTQLNLKLAALAQQEGVSYLDLTPNFADSEGKLRRELTTDGLHLSPVGYVVWGEVMQATGGITVAMR